MLSPELIQVAQEVASDWLTTIIFVPLYFRFFVFLFQEMLSVDVEIIIETDVLLHGPLG